MTVYHNPGTEGSNVRYRERYDNYIGGDWVAPVDGEYFDNITPVTGEVFCQVARGKEADINLAIDAAGGKHSKVLRPEGTGDGAGDGGAGGGLRGRGPRWG